MNFNPRSWTNFRSAAFFWSRLNTKEAGTVQSERVRHLLSLLCKKHAAPSRITLNTRGRERVQRWVSRVLCIKIIQKGIIKMILQKNKFLFGPAPAHPSPYRSKQTHFCTYRHLNIHSFRDKPLKKRDLFSLKNKNLLIQVRMTKL